ncbi:MAG: hypothetical protein PHW52_01195 [Candidatus Pacebacteria bacterium]|nr:hypothetical protein [Candidatus Paceibacterota bacterium]
MISNGRNYIVLDMTLGMFRKPHFYDIVSLPEFIAPRLNEIFSFQADSYPEDTLLERMETFFNVLTMARNHLLFKDPSMQRIKIVFGHMPDYFARMLDDRLIERSIEPIYCLQFKKGPDELSPDGRLIAMNEKFFVIARPYQRLFEADFSNEG